MNDFFERNHRLYPLITAVVMGLLIFLVYHLNAPNPNMILITALVLATGTGGMGAGILPAVMMMGYSLFFFSTDHSFFSYTAVNLQKVIISAIGIVFCFLCVGLLKRNADRSRHKFQKANAELTTANDRLQREAEDALKIAELQQSVSSLLTNMPALTFSKDIRTGKYLACNQAFAEYANKERPEDVVGLTDYEIFDPVTAQHFVEDDKVGIAREEPYVFFEDVMDAAGNPKQFRTTKQKFTDTQGRLCLLGMSMDVTDLEAVKSASATYSNIAQALSADYFNLFYVDLETQRFIEYASPNAEGVLAEERSGENFFSLSRQDALSLLHPDDREAFVRAFTRENVIHSMDENGAFTHQYRLLNGGDPVHVMMKATRMPGDDRHIIIGVNSIEAQMREQEALARIQQERITYSRITALSGDYICVYTVDPRTDHYIEYSVKDNYASLGLDREGEDFFGVTRRESGKVVCLEDVERFQSLMTRENVMREIENQGLFVVEYRIMIREEPVYVSLKAALVEEKDGPQLIVGISNIDAQVKREREYANNLAEARNKANLDALTGVKNKHAYIDVEAGLNRQIDEKHPVSFAIAVFDVNNLKRVNDNQGHLSGDKLIREACDIICGVFKRSPVYRIGGDEFAVVVQGCDYEHIEERMAAMEAHNRENLKIGRIVIACGMAKYENDRNVAAVFERADKQMYADKRALKGDVA